MKKRYQYFIKPRFIIISLILFIGCAGRASVAETPTDANKTGTLLLKAAQDTGKIETSKPANRDLMAQVKEQAPAKGATTTPARPVVDPDDPNSPLYLGTGGKPAGRGDPTKPAGEAYKLGAGWHPQALQIAGLPKDKYGLIDWVKMSKEGLIKPKATLDPKDPKHFEPYPQVLTKDELEMETVILTKSDYLSDVVFPHSVHNWWLKCKTCHPKRFARERGGTPILMREMAQGKWCGMCHGKVAFPLSDCARCHVKAKKAGG